jgi:hypothetical protein
MKKNDNRILYKCQCGFEWITSEKGNVLCGCCGKEMTSAVQIEEFKELDCVEVDLPEMVCY